MKRGAAAVLVAAGGIGVLVSSATAGAYCMDGPSHRHGRGWAAFWTDRGAGAGQAPGSAVASSPADGQRIVESVCASCHAAGLFGAPRIGVRSDWNPRIANGPNILLRHALTGYGAMPARGGQPALTDTEVKQAVAYLLEQVGLRDAFGRKETRGRAHLATGAGD